MQLQWTGQTDTTFLFLTSASRIITFHVRHSRGKMYSGHGRLCVCLSLAAFPHYCTDPDASWENGRGCPVVVHYWAELQSVHGFHCYDNIAPNAKCQWVFVLTLCLVMVALWNRADHYIFALFNGHKTVPAVAVVVMKKMITRMIIYHHHHHR